MGRRRHRIALAPQVRSRRLAPVVAGVIALGACGGSPEAEDEARPTAVPTRGVEHLRMVEISGGDRRTVELWEHVPADGCWSMRTVWRSSGGRDPAGEARSTVVRGDGGEPRRISALDGETVTEPRDACGFDREPTRLQFLRALASSPVLRPAGTVRSRGRLLTVLEGPPDQFLLGRIDAARSTAVAEVTPVPAGARMRYVFDAVARHPVRLEVPAARVVLEPGGAPARVPAMTVVVTLTEEVPATPAAMAVFRARAG